MADLMEQGSNWHEAMRTRFASRPVTYSRGADSVELAATIGKTVFRVDKGYGISERTEARDYLITAAELILADHTILPKAGDRVREVEGGKAYTYEVMAPGGEPCWRWSDAYRRTLRIHTKQIAVEEA